MELSKNRYDSIIWVLFLCLSMLISCSVSFEDADSFGEFVHKYANNSVSKPRTGVVYNISLPSNYTGIEVCYIRLRSSSFWVKGENWSWISIPPRVTPLPFVRRIAIVFENLGNWSSTFYQVPGYTLVAPVIGFTVYNSSSNSTALGNRKLDLFFMGRKSILVKFPRVELGVKKIKPQCVVFGAGGVFELKNMTKPNLCSVSDYGYFSLVIPTPSPVIKERKKKLLWEWWVIGFGCGLVGLGLFGLVLMGVLRFLRRRNIEDMERESERGVSFGTVWIGKSRMPSASMVRTQPALENSYAL